MGINVGPDKEHNWISIRLTGSVEKNGPVNRDAIGTRVYLHTSDGQFQMQEVRSGSSLGAGNDIALYFGLGESDIESVFVQWPDGRERIFVNVPINQTWELNHAMSSKIYP